MIQRLWVDEDRIAVCQKLPTWELRVGAHSVDVCEDHAVALLHLFLEMPTTIVPTTVLPIEDPTPPCAWPGAVS